MPRMTPDGEGLTSLELLIGMLCDLLIARGVLTIEEFTAIKLDADAKAALLSM